MRQFWVNDICCPEKENCQWTQNFVFRYLLTDAALVGWSTKPWQLRCSYITQWSNLSIEAVGPAKIPQNNWNHEFVIVSLFYSFVRFFRSQLPIFLSKTFVFTRNHHLYDQRTFTLISVIHWSIGPIFPTVCHFR